MNYEHSNCKISFFFSPSLTASCLVNIIPWCRKEEETPTFARRIGQFSILISSRKKSRFRKLISQFRRLSVPGTPGRAYSGKVLRSRFFLLNTCSRNFQTSLYLFHLPLSLFPACLPPPFCRFVFLSSIHPPTPNRIHLADSSRKLSTFVARLLPRIAKFSFPATPATIFLPRNFRRPRDSNLENPRDCYWFLVSYRER